MEQNSIELPPDSDVELQIVRHSLTQCEAQLLINGVVYGKLNSLDDATGTFTTVGAFRTPKSGYTIIYNMNRNWKFDFSLFRKMFGLGE